MNVGAPLLEIRGLSVDSSSGGFLAGVDLDVAGGEALGILGPNGAGKTLLLRVIAGLERPTGGVVRFDGRALSGPVSERVARGIVLVPAQRAIFGGLTVLDNLLAGCHRFAWDTDRVRRRLEMVLTTFVALGPRLGQRAGSLSGGEQQMLALGKALLLEPRLLLVDELTLGLAPVAVAGLLDVLDGLRRAGTSLVVVEQSPDTLAALVGRVAWMEQGQLRWTGPPGHLPATADLTA